MKYLRPKDVEKEYGLSLNQLKVWEDKGLITPARTPGGHRRYRPEDLERLLNKTTQEEN